MSRDDEMGHVRDPSDWFHEYPQDVDFLGLTEREAEAQAKSKGVQLRVVVRDGSASELTLDLAENRVNLILVAGKVSDARRF